MKVNGAWVRDEALSREGVLWCGCFDSPFPADLLTLCHSYSETRDTVNW